MAFLASLDSLEPPTFHMDTIPARTWLSDRANFSPNGGLWLGDRNLPSFVPLSCIPSVHFPEPLLFSTRFKEVKVARLDQEI